MKTMKSNNTATNTSDANMTIRKQLFLAHSGLCTYPDTKERDRENGIK